MTEGSGLEDTAHQYVLEWKERSNELCEEQKEGAVLRSTGELPVSRLSAGLK